MCYAYGAVPPLPPDAGAPRPGEQVIRTAGDGTDLLAWRAEAAGPSGAGVVILRSPGRARSIVTVGFCFGGWYSFLQALRGELGLAGVIGFYGGMKPRSEGAATPITAAPHSFFDRAYADFADECADVWRRVRGFIAARTTVG